MGCRTPGPILYGCRGVGMRPAHQTTKPDFKASTKAAAIVAINGG
jgi:hypothetical protein